MKSRSIYTFELNNNYKIQNLKKIYVGERIRDMVYFKKIDAILLALEDTGSIGFLKIPSIN